MEAGAILDAPPREANDIIPPPPGRLPAHIEHHARTMGLHSAGQYPVAVVAMASNKLFQRNSAT
jgi:hypothetical protein